MINRIKNIIRNVITEINANIVRSKKIKYSYGLNTHKRDTEIILSLTSFPSRFPYLHICLNSLLHQTVKPDKIIVWLDDYVSEKQFTAEMIKLKDYGIDYRFVPGDLKPHKKYLFAMKAFPYSIIITVDDDIIYPTTVISSLLKSYKKNPSCVSARRVHKILWDDTGSLMPYVNWIHQYTRSRKPGFDLLATGIGGILYPPRILPEEAYDMDRIRELSLKADDIWLKFMEMRSSVPVTWAKCIIVHPPTIEGTQQESLNNSNIIENDAIIGNMVKRYPECLSKIINFCSRI